VCVLWVFNLSFHQFSSELLMIRSGSLDYEQNCVTWELGDKSRSGVISPWQHQLLSPFCGLLVLKPGTNPLFVILVLVIIPTLTAVWKSEFLEPALTRRSRLERKCHSEPLNSILEHFREEGRTFQLHIEA